MYLINVYIKCVQQNKATLVLAVHLDDLYSHSLHSVLFVHISNFQLHELMKGCLARQIFKRLQYPQVRRLIAQMI